MNIKAIIAAAGLAIAGLGAEAPAEAHPRYSGYDGYYDGRYDRHYGYDRWDRRDWRDDRRHWRKHRKHWRNHHDRRHYGWNDRRGRDCWREWHRGRRVTVCSNW